MRTVSKALLTVVLFWSVGAPARQPAPYLPKPELTPGDVFDVTLEDICTPGYTRKVRAVPSALRTQAFKSYGIASDRRSEYQLDHLIPLALGGSNSIKNLWPQPNHTSPWDARAKDRLEVRLQRLVCGKKLALETAQREIAANWTEAYQRFMGTSPPSVAKLEPLLAQNVTTERPPKTSAAPTGAKNEVWVNTRSGIYWKPGSRHFGKTKEGKFMAESDAVAAGYRAARVDY